MSKTQFYAEGTAPAAAEVSTFVAGIPVQTGPTLPTRIDLDPTVAVALPKVKGRKDDSGKVRMELMNDLPRAEEGVAKVLTWAVTNKMPVPYEPGSWLNVDDFYNRYSGALRRHWIALAKGGFRARDKETGLLELYHIATNAMFLAEKISRDIEAEGEQA